MGFRLFESVWERDTGADEMSLRGYIAAVTNFTLYGIIVALLVGFNTRAWQPGWALFLLVGLGIPIVGILISVASDNWLISLFGYTLVTVGLGAICGPAVAMYKTHVVLSALAATGGVTLTMSLVGILYPRSLESWGSYLFGALLALFFARIAQSFMAAFGAPESLWYMPWLNYAGTVLFSLYIIFDWNRAVRLPHTLDNAVDSAVAIFLDIINLFMHLLQIFGGSSSDD